jgi:hypothetical protein
MYCKSPLKLADSGRKVYIVSALNPNACAHLLGGQGKDDAQVTIWDRSSHGHQANLQWTIHRGPNGTYHIASVADPNFVFHQLGANRENGGRISVWNKNTHGHQGNLQVHFDHKGGDWWAIRFAHSNKCVHVQGAQTGNNNPITQWDYVDQANLKWSFVPVKPKKQYKKPEKFAKSGKKFYLVSALSPNACAHLLGGQGKDDAQVTIWDKNTHGHQANLQWTIHHGPNGTYHIASVADPNFVFHQLGATNENGGRISVWNKNTHGHQGNLQVRFEKVEKGWWAIRFAHSNKCVHVQGAQTGNNTPITQWDYVNQANLKWRFVPVK